MEILSERLGGEEFHNWLDVAVSISITKDGIVDFMKHKVENLHRKIKYGTCAALPYCSHNCSKTKTNLSTWCYTCTKWKSQIMLYNRYAGRRHKIKWTNINSKEWPTNINEMVKVFAPEWWDGTTCYTEDLSVAISVIHNCTEFVFPAGVCQGVRDVRNGMFAHGSQRVSALEKKEALRKLRLFLTQPGISHTPTGKSAIKMLTLLTKRNVIDIIVKDRNKYLECQLSEVVYPTRDEERNLMNESQEIQDLRIALQNLDIWKERTKQRVGYFRRQSLLIWICFICQLSLLTYCMGRSSPDFMKKDSPFHMQSSCLPLQFSSPCPWTPDITFDTYLEDHPTLFGRKWLLEKIQNTLTTNTGKGILLAAEMGYGKSALAAHIVCGGDLPETDFIKKHLLSYHICKFDVLRTQKPEYFIRNLVGMMIKFLPEVGNAILSDNQAIKYLETKECSEDPIYCFDIAIVHPLRRVTFDEDRYIVIDAIDECEETDSLPVSLVQVISNRLGKLPGWIKFFITARNIPAVTSKFKMLKRLDLTSMDAENQEDIRTYLKYKFSDDSSIFLPVFTTTTEKNIVIENLVKISRAHFLYVVLALKDWNQNMNGSIDKFPQSLNDLYALNLERAFKNNYENFPLARGIFEVLCTTSRPLTLNNLETILNVSSDPYSLRNILGNQLAHFIRNNRSINIYHKTICDYLSSNASLYTPFHISISTGHAWFAKYMLKKIKRGKTVDDDVIDLVIHIVEAKDEDLWDSFQKSKSIFKNYSSTAPTILHKMARRKDSIDATKLLVDALAIKDIDTKSPANVTACFLAAAFGKAQTLKYLVEKGCNISFRVNRHPDEIGLDDAVNYCKQKALWGYGLLDIASQNGHINVVDMLLSLKNMGYPEENGLGLTPVHLAAENGHTEILAKLLSIDNTSANQHSLYLASKHGHTDVVSVLLKYGVQDTCLQCDGEFYWLKNNTKRMQWNYCFNSTDQINCVIETSDHFQSTETTVVLHDDERFIKCTTALEIAIQNGHTDIVRLLLKERVNALNCREYGGRTPLLTSIKYNQYDIFDMILEIKGDVDDKCVSTWNVLDTYNVHQLNMKELKELDQERCPLGAGAQHLLAMYDKEEMIDNLNERGLTLDWKKFDSSGATPLHYAACNNRMNVTVILIKRLHISPTIRARNGSMPIHSAVVCNAFNSYFLFRYLSNSIVPIEDDYGRGLLHYLSLSDGSFDMFYLINHETDGISSSMRDKDLNNFLHYAAAKGQANLIEFIFKSNHSEFVSLFLEMNIKNKTMLDVAFDKLPNNGVLYRALGCDFFNMFFQSCKINYRLLPKEEYFIVYSLQSAFQYPEVKKMIDFQRYAGIAISKSNTLMLWCICVYKPSTMTLSVGTENVGAFFDLDNPPQYMASILLRYLDDLCNLPFNQSLVHRILRNKANKYWVYFADAEFQFGSEILSKGNISFWRRCLDIDGFNILHHAVMGGNYFAVRYLLKKGMGLSGLKGKSLLYLSVWNAPLLPNVRRVLWDFRDICLMQDNKVLIEILRETSLTDHDKVAVYLFRKLHKKRKITENSLCNSTSTRLGLVHKVAIVGMMKLLAVLDDTFGRRVLECRNLHNFTPRYLAKLFNQSSVVEYLEKRSVMLVYPDSIVEKVVLRALSTHLSNSSELTPTPNYESLVIKFSHPYWFKIENKYLPNVILEIKLKKIKSDFNRTIHELSKLEKVVNTKMRSAIIHVFHEISAVLLSLRKTSVYIREITELCQIARSCLPNVEYCSVSQRNSGFHRRHLLTKMSKQLIKVLELIYLYYEGCVTKSFITDSNLTAIFSDFHALRLANISQLSLTFVKRFHILNTELSPIVKTDYIPDTSNILKSNFLYQEFKSMLKNISIPSFKIPKHLKLFRNSMNTTSLPLENSP